MGAGGIRLPAPEGGRVALHAGGLGVDLVAGLLWRDTGISSCLVTFWLKFAFGIGYVATKALHLPDWGSDTGSRPRKD